MSVRTLLLLTIYLIFNRLSGQSLSVFYEENTVDITSAHLHPPQTAGADYAPTIMLSQGAFVTVQDVRSRTQWCLMAYSTTTLPGNTTLTIFPDISSVPAETVGMNTPSQLLLGAQPQPLFSGIGTVDQLLLTFTLDNAHVSQNVHTTPIYIQYQLQEGGCPTWP